MILRILPSDQPARSMAAVSGFVTAGACQVLGVLGHLNDAYAQFSKEGDEVKPVFKSRNI
jgi:hypothetical protein